MSLTPVLPLDDAASPVDDSVLLVFVDIPSGRVRLSGALDSGSAHLLSEALLVLAATPRRTWTLDLAGVRFCDSDGLSALLRARRDAVGSGRRVVLERTSAPVDRVLALTGTSDLLADPPVAR